MTTNLKRALAHADMTEDLAELFSVPCMTLTYELDTNIDTH
jgi:hypothetical protein